MGHYTELEVFDTKIRWDGKDHITVEVNPSMMGKTCGLCGNYNGDPKDDFKTPQV